jgi:hypothetical protein
VSGTLPSAETPSERRTYHRVPVSIAGRYMLEDKREFPCRTADMSSGGASLVVPVRGDIGERIIVYLDYMGRLEGVITRHTDVGFAVVFILTGPKRERIADQLTWLLNRDCLREEDRRHERIVPLLRHCIMSENGQEHLVKLIDVSVSGAAITTDRKIPRDTKIVLGSTRGRVIRTFENGVAVEFDTAIPMDRFDENIRL